MKTIQPPSRLCLAPFLTLMYIDSMKFALLLLVAGVRVMGLLLPLDQKHGVFSNAHPRQV